MAKKSAAQKSLPVVDEAEAIVEPAPAFLDAGVIIEPAQRDDVAVIAVHVDSIADSPTNPRKTMGDLTELAESIKKAGVLQPILVRKVNLGGGGLPYEVVFGHRRLHAARVAGLAEILAQVRDLTDQQVAELQLVENAQREDVSPLEEADAYRRLHDEFGLSADAIAQRVGKSKASVYAAMKLADLVDPNLRAAVAAGVVSASVALHVARLDPEKQAKAAAAVIKGHVDFEYEDGKSVEVCTPFSVRDVRAYLNEVFATRLEKAQFDGLDAMLFPEAGACVDCPKRTNRDGDRIPQGILLDDDDLCTDFDCFKKKESLTIKAKLDEARAAGERVLGKKEIEQAYSEYGLKHSGPFVMDSTWSADHSRSWGDLRKAAEKKGHPVESALAREPGTINIVELYEVAELKKALKSAGISAKSSAWDKPTPLKDEKPASKKDVEEEERRQLAADILCATVAAIRPTPEHDAKLVRLFIAATYGPYSTALDQPTRQVKSEEENSGSLFLSCFDHSAAKITSKDLDTQGNDVERLEVLAKVPAKALREIALEAALSSDITMMSGDAIDHRGEEAVQTMTVIGKLFGVDVAALKKHSEERLTLRMEAREEKSPGIRAAIMARQRNPFKAIASAGRKAVKKIVAKSSKKPKAKK